MTQETLEKALRLMSRRDDIQERIEKLKQARDKFLMNRIEDGRDALDSAMRCGRDFSARNQAARTERKDAILTAMCKTAAVRIKQEIDLQNAELKKVQQEIESL